MKRLRRDNHPGPHLMKDGGCYCLCPSCTSFRIGIYRCVCPRCNEDCTGFGRLGTAAMVAEERLLGYPTGGRPARRWYWR